METIEIDQAVLHINQLLEIAAKGKDIIITKNHQPIVKLSSIKKEKIRKVKEAFRKNVTICIGVEIGNEWVRKYWLNKDTSNQQIEKAIAVAHEEKAILGATIILGMPGLSERQSIELLFQTISWLISTPLKYIQIGYLVRKDRTVQNYLYQELRNDEDLCSLGVVKREKTGLLNIIILFDTIIKIFENNPGAERKTIFSPQNFIDNAKLYKNKDIYGPLTEMEMRLLDIIEEITRVGVKDVSKYKSLYDDIKKTPEYEQAMTILSRQPGLAEMRQTMQLVGRKISEKLFAKERRKAAIEDLENDLLTMRSER
jgi:antitoxin (DNA-binding transcriptional repressor) of toxin-antitoxin stability system